MPGARPIRSTVRSCVVRLPFRQNGGQRYVNLLFAVVQTMFVLVYCNRYFVRMTRSI